MSEYSLLLGRRGGSILRRSPGGDRWRVYASCTTEAAAADLLRDLQELERRRADEAPSRRKGRVARAVQ